MLLFFVICAICVFCGFVFVQLRFWKESGAMLEHLAQTLHIPLGRFYVLAAGVMVSIGLLLGLTLNRVFHRYAQRFAATRAEWFFSLLQSFSIPLLVLASLYTALENFTLPLKYEHLLSKLIFVLVLLVVFYFPARIATLGLRRLGQKEPQLQRITQPATFLIKLLFTLVALVIMLENFGIHLTAIWTTLGIGSVAVALALQETLSNFFAGLYLLADRPISPGDYIRLDSGQEGYVVRVGWRATSIRPLSYNVVFVPNSVLAKAVITNYSLPDESVALNIQVGVAYGTDARRVEQILVEIAQQAAQPGEAGGASGSRVEGLLADPPPSAKLIPGFGNSTLDFTLGVQVRRFVDQYAVQSELRKRILERFLMEGIEMPFPTQTILLESSKQSAVGKSPSGERV
jgi:small-conductance mechanosensitive channel